MVASPRAIDQIKVEHPRSAISQSSSRLIRAMPSTFERLAKVVEMAETSSQTLPAYQVSILTGGSGLSLIPIRSRQ